MRHSLFRYIMNKNVEEEEKFEDANEFATNDHDDSESEYESDEEEELLTASKLRSALTIETSTANQQPQIFSGNYN